MHACMGPFPLALLAPIPTLSKLREEVFPIPDPFTRFLKG